jgi:chromosome partitioning protein
MGMMRTVLVANPKGGSGKTTLATNLAGFFASRNQRVGLWDLDDQQSSMEWLALRSNELPSIGSVSARGYEDQGEASQTYEWVVLDSPAGMHGREFNGALTLADKVLVPVQPSIFDMSATRDFLDRLMEEKKVRRYRPFVGVIGMRVDPRTRPAATLEQFLAQYDLPVVTYLRDTMVYVNAAFTGRSIFDLPAYQAERDLQQWHPLIEWISA